MGRPSSYKPDVHIPMGKSLYSIGLTDEEVAREFEMSTAAVRKWAVKYPAFKKVRTEGRALPNSRVVAALYKRAVGYDVYEEVWELERPKLPIDPKTKKVIRSRGRPKTPKLIKTKIIKKHIVPDVLAAIYWTKNRMSEEWSDRHQIEGTGTVTAIVVPTKEQIDQMIASDIAGRNNGNGKNSGGNGHKLIKDVTGTGN